MSMLFSPLDGDLRNAGLEYVSKAKLEQLLLPTERGGFSISLPGIEISVDNSKYETRELLTQATRFFQDQNLLTYANTAQRGQWLLLRAVMTCGTAWPTYGGDPSPATETAWWVGSSDSARILAYGNRRHLLGQGSVPEAASTDGTPTWWPSRADAYLELLKNVSLNTRGEISDPWSDDVAAQVEGLERFFFNNDGVLRGTPLVSPGIYEMMLRVDRVVESGGAVTILGSPLWVARELRSVQGVYYVRDATNETAPTIVGNWDGNEWKSFKIEEVQQHRLGPLRKPEYRYVAPVDLGFSPPEPSADDIAYLGEPPWEQPEPLPRHDPDEGGTSILQRLLRWLKR